MYPFAPAISDPLSFQSSSVIRWTLSRREQFSLDTIGALAEVAAILDRRQRRAGNFQDAPIGAAKDKA